MPRRDLGSVVAKARPRAPAAMAPPAMPAREPAATLVTQLPGSMKPIVTTKPGPR